MAFDFRPFIFDENLRHDGSNFGEKNILLYVIEEPLKYRPNDSAGEDAYEDWHDDSDIYIRVECLMHDSMTYDLRVQFNNTRANEITDGLKILFGAQVRIARHECLDDFLFNHDGRKDMSRSALGEDA